MSDYLSGLKSIIHSKRGNVFFIERCRIMVKEDRVVYLTESQKEKLYWNIPIANTTTILLGTGTSITQGAFRLLSAAGVVVGFCGSGGTPLFAGSEVEWITPQSEYRPTKYVQGWMGFWFDEDLRLDVGREFQLARLDFIDKAWRKSAFRDAGIDIRKIEKSISRFEKDLQAALSVSSILSAEAVLTKSLYRYVASVLSMSFRRNHDGSDNPNIMLNHGNYLAYGLAATCLWVLGIPHGFSVVHGKTRRGALVFDVADIVKDGVVLPTAFISAKNKLSEQEFRDLCIENLQDSKALDYMFKVVKSQAERFIN